MTQHHDPVHPDDPGDPGDPGATLSAADDAYVSSLLAGLPDVAMPDDVRARLDAALAELAAAEPPVGVVTGATVVPFTAAPSRWRNPRILQAAAALVLAIGAGAVGVKALSGSASSNAMSAAAGASPDAARGPAAPATITGHDYTTASLAGDVQQLVASHRGSISKDASSGGASPPPPVLTKTYGPTASPVPGLASEAEQRAELFALAGSIDKLGPCIAAIEADIKYVPPLAVDAGTYNGSPALVVVLPGNSDPTSYDVFIVEPTCGLERNDHLITYRLVPRA